ncbi:MAG: EAL domain-containing protein [Acidobacteriota bacterium]|nr:EAL domain-containing protein [Acidobacteriota bacterium]
MLGALSALHSITHFPVKQIGFGYLVLVAVTLGLGSRIIVKIPRCKGQISVSDTFVMLSLLLYGVEAAVLLAGADALASCLRTSRKKLNIAFNTAVFLCSTFLTGVGLRLFFGSMTALTAQDFTPAFLFALSAMGLLQYGANSGLVATAVALRAGEPIYKMWYENFLWTSLTYFAGSFAAGIIAKLTTTIGIFAFLATAPIIAIIYFTYSIYLKNVEAAAKQAELAQIHVEQLNQHLAEQERISNALKESEEHFRSAFDHAVGMALVSPDGHWLEVNESLSSLLGYTRQELKEMSFRTILHPEDLGATLVAANELIEGVVTSFQLENRYIHKQGHTIWVLSSASLVREENGSAKHMVFQVQNISDRKQAEDQIRFAAFHDSLTGLPNRTLLADRMSMAVERAKRSSNYKFAVLFIDLDRFKIVNDTMGHEMGDKLLIDLSNRLKECVRAVDTVARLGGDEFAVLLDGITNQELAIEIADRIQTVLSQPFDLDGQEFFTSASIGISFSSMGYESPEDILRDADTAMYRAKANGKARYEVFDLSMHTRAVEALKLENDLRQGIERGQVHAYYQPIISLENGSIVGFEALARWEHPKRGLIPPVDFIPLAEETGLIVPLGMTIIKEACQQLGKWQTMFNTEKPLTMSINLSAKQFAQKDLVEEIRKVIEDAKIEPDCIRLEVTETIVMENAHMASEILKQLKSIGVQLSIDDFGTGYSSLSYLHRFPFDILKIDRSFVNRMNTDKDSLSIVETIVTLAKKLCKSIVAEGVEHKKHEEALRLLSCDYGQGYLYSKPLNAKCAEELLRSSTVSRDVEYQNFNVIPQQNAEIIANRYAM